MIKENGESRGVKSVCCLQGSKILPYIRFTVRVVQYLVVMVNDTIPNFVIGK